MTEQMSDVEKWLDNYDHFKKCVDMHGELVAALTEARDDLVSLEETNRRLNRRVQEAESKAYQSGGMVYKKMHGIISENNRLRAELSMQKTMARAFRRKAGSL